MDDAHLPLRTIIGRQLPGFDVRSIEHMGEGLDNTAYLVNGELVVRQAKVPDPDAIRREVAVLGIASRHATLPIPEVVFADTDAGILAYRKLPGRPLMGMAPEDSASIATSLGEFLAAIHCIPLAEVEDIVPRDDDPPEVWLAEATVGYQEIAGHIPVSVRHRIEAFLAESLPLAPVRLGFCHNDFGAEHILVDPQTIQVTGVIDWTDAAVTDPMRDHALVLRDLGPDALSHALEAYGLTFVPEDLARLRFYARCKLIEDLAYGIETGNRSYVDAALAHLDWTF